MESMNPLVHIIIPVYNGEKYLGECLDSVFGQTYQNIHVVCVDDGSTDGSAGILSHYSEKHPNLTVISKENGGVSSARNAGLDYIELCPNEFVMFVDADDYLRLDYVEAMVNAALGNSAEIVASSFTTVRGDKQTKFSGMDSIFGFHDAFEATRLLIEDRTIQSHSHCKLYRASLWNDIRFPVGMFYMEDQATIYRVFCKSNLVYFINDYGYFYRNHPDSVCGRSILIGKTVNALEMYRSVLEYPFEEFEAEQRASLKDAALQAYANCALMMLPRFEKKTATDQQREMYKIHLSFIRKNKIIQKFKPQSRMERIKKAAFLLCRPLYVPLFRLAKRIA